MQIGRTEDEAVRGEATAYGMALASGITQVHWITKH